MLVDEAYNEYQGSVTVLTPDYGVISIQGDIALASNEARPVSVPIHLGLALLKGPAMDLAIQKACELGVTTITPLSFTRSVVKLDAAAAAQKQKRWQKLAQEAAQQAKLLYVPQMAPLLSLGQFGAGVEAHVLQIFCNEHEQERSLKHMAADIAEAAAIYLITGPEGGFTLDESNFLKQVAWHSVSLGPTTLRAETAPLVALAQLRVLMD